MFRKIVCPPFLQSGLFTCSAIDNIDHDPSSSTAQNSYHGTSISIFQFPDHSTQKQKFHYSGKNTEGIICILPDSFTQIMPTKDFKPEPVDRNNEHKIKESTYEMAKVHPWLEKLSTCSTIEHQEEQVSFSAYFSKEVSEPMPQTISALLPLLNESINSKAMVRHCIEIVKDITNSLNPGQKVLITGDQPVYALGKQVQWIYNDEYQNVVWMMGPLHVVK